MSTTILEQSVNTRPRKQPLSGLKANVQSAARNWSGRAFFTFMDQGLISGAGFLTTILLARMLVPQEYGSFALAFMIFMFLTILYNAFVLEPMAVFGSSVYRNSFKRYLGVLLRAHILSGTVAVGFVGISAWALTQIMLGESVTRALFAAAIAAPCVLLFKLARRAFYVELCPRDAAVGGVVYFFVVTGGLLVLWAMGTLSPAKAFLVMAASGLITAATVLARLKSHLPSGAKGPNLSALFRKHWEYGRWAAASAVAIWLGQTFFYPFLGSVRGLVEVGKLKALLNFTSPVAQVFAAVSLLALPYASRVYHQHGLASTRRLLWKLTVVHAGGASLYWAVLIVWRDPIVHFLYAGRYADVAYLMPWIALSSVLRISATASAVTLKAMNSPTLVFVAYFASCLAAILIGVPCAWLFGLPGAIIAVALSSGVALIVVVVMVLRRSSSSGVKLPVLQGAFPGSVE